MTTAIAPEEMSVDALPPPKTIEEAILRVYKNVGYVQKQRGDGLRYTYAGEAALIEAIRPAMIEAGVTMRVESIDDLRLDTYETSSNAVMNHTVLRASVIFMHAASGTFARVSAVGEGADVGDKSANKAMTGAFKYALRQTFCIETGDDPDDTPSDGMERATKGRRGPIREPQATSGRDGEFTMTSKFPSKCSSCGKDIGKGEQIIFNKETKAARHPGCAPIVVRMSPETGEMRDVPEWTLDELSALVKAAGLEMTAVAAELNIDKLTRGNVRTAVDRWLFENPDCGLPDLVAAAATGPTEVTPLFDVDDTSTEPAWAGEPGLH